MAKLQITTRTIKTVDSSTLADIGLKKSVFALFWDSENKIGEVVKVEKLIATDKELYLATSKAECDAELERRLAIKEDKPDNIKDK